MIYVIFFTSCSGFFFFFFILLDVRFGAAVEDRVHLMC
jgi:hypothetical protein